MSHAVSARPTWLAVVDREGGGDDRGEDRDGASPVGVGKPRLDLGVWVELGDVLGDQQQEGTPERDRSEANDPGVAVADRHDRGPERLHLAPMPAHPLAHVSHQLHRTGVQHPLAEPLPRVLKALVEERLRVAATARST